MNYRCTWDCNTGNHPTIRMFALCLPCAISRQFTVVDSEISTSCMSTQPIGNTNPRNKSCSMCFLSRIHIYVCPYVCKTIYKIQRFERSIAVVTHRIIEYDHRAQVMDTLHQCLFENVLSIQSLFFYCSTDERYGS